MHGERRVVGKRARIVDDDRAGVRGHIYMVLPAQQPGAITATWTTNGRLLPGQVSTGGRALVYAGPITAPFIEDMVHLTVIVDGRRMVQSYPVNFRFEMEED